jgi:hypothetical protein
LGLFLSLLFLGVFVMMNTYQDNLTQFDDLFRENKKIFVINNTEPKGLLSTTINDPISGKAIKLEFPRTWIPFCLTSMLPRNVLEHNVELRRTLQKNTLKIIPEAQAQEMLSSPRGRAEYSRLTESEFAAGSKIESARKTAMVNSVKSGEQALNSPDNQSAEEELTLHTKMRPWEQRIVVGEMDGPALINELEIHANELTSHDLQYLTTAQFPQDVKSYAQERLNTGTFRNKSLTSGSIPMDKYESDWDIELGK